MTRIEEVNAKVDRGSNSCNTFSVIALLDLLRKYQAIACCDDK
ncbi:MAG: hypothetical protein ACRCZS_09925 [Chroococcidiopsis sp.]